MQHGPKLSTQTVRHHRNQEYEQKLILADQNNIPENCSRGIRVSTLVVEQQQHQPRTQISKKTEEDGRFGERTDFVEVGEVWESEDGMGVNG